MSYVIIAMRSQTPINESPLNLSRSARRRRSLPWGLLGEMAPIRAPFSESLIDFYGKSRPCAIEGNWLLRRPRNQRLIERIEIEPDYALPPWGKFLSRETLTVLTKCGLSVRMPDPPGAAIGDAGSHSHAAQARIRRLDMQGRMNHLLDLLGGQWLGPRRAGRVLQQPIYPLRHALPAPAAYREQALAHCRGNRLRRQPTATRFTPSRSPSAAYFGPGPAVPVSHDKRR